MLADLMQYVEMHFGTEERLMESFEYPLRDMHALKHLEVRERLKTLIQQQDEASIAVRVLCESRRWLKEHILDWDAKLGEYLNARGVT
jgi:hemerythrin-like metal-binding protein